MERLLLLVDEMDDLFGTLRAHWVGLRRGAAMLILSVLGAGAVLGVVAVGLAPLVFCIGAVAASAVVAFGVRRHTAV